MMDDEFDDAYFSNETATFGDRVAAARAARGLSQQDMAKKLGVKLKTAHGWEDDISEPRANKLQMLAGLLNVSIMWLLTGEGDGLSNARDRESLPTDIDEILTELRRTRAQYARLTDKLGRLEKRLQKALNTGS
jgi:transcriptional regulator with XRE-family HTH domain